jgi:hypothetical protein
VRDPLHDAGVHPVGQIPQVTPRSGRKPDLFGHYIALSNIAKSMSTAAAWRNRSAVVA